MYVISFLFSLHIAISAYVNSTFLTSIISEKYVGLLYSTAAFIALFALSRSSSILKYFGNRKLILWLLLFNMFALMGMITSINPYIIGLSFIIFSVTNTLVFLSIDIFIERFANAKSMGKTRGLYLTIISLAWMLSPLITSYFITHDGGYKTIYIISFIATIIMTIGLVFSVRTFKDSVYKKTPFLKTFKFLKKNHHMLAITMINFLLQFFYAWMVVYIPIYLFKHLGFSWEQIGVMFTIMLSPFVIFDMPIGILVDKYHIKKSNIIFTGFIIIILSTSLIAITKSHDMVIWAFLLFLSRVGASFVETASDIYLFTHITEEDAYLLGIYRDMGPLAYIISPIIATIVFIYIPFNYLFLVLSFILLAGFYYIPKLRHNHTYGLPNKNK